MKFIQLLIAVTLCGSTACTKPTVDQSETPGIQNQDIPETAQIAKATVKELDPKKAAEAAAKVEAEEEARKAAEVDRLKAEKEAQVKAEKAEKEQAKKEKRSAERRKKRAERKEKERAEKAKEEIASGKGQMTFKETEFNFGVLKQGEKVQHDFVFENTGDGDLEILNVDVTCGCTVPTFPFIPIAPGEKGTIGVTYNSTGKLGNQKPMITIITNTKPSKHKIYMKGVVDAERAKRSKEEAATPDGGQ